ncbi:DUF6580 family putative transport protein [Haloferula helveola]
MRASWIAGLLLVGLLIAFRVISAAGFLPNFSPLPALFLCSIIFFRGTRAWLLPVLAWVVTDPLVSIIQGYPVIGPHHVGIAVGLLASVLLGLALRRRPSNANVLLGSMGAAFLFYFVTNLLSFLGDPLYAKNVTGFIQSQWTGPQGFPPTWIFLRNLAAANLLFTGLFLAARPAWCSITTEPNLLPAKTR